MNLVAKPYQEYTQVGNAFTKNGKNYITVETKEGLKEVRLYTVEEYNFLLGMQTKKDLIEKERAKVAQSYNDERRINAGFKEGYVVAVLGDTYKDRKNLKEMGAKFSNHLKWFFEGGTFTLNHNYIRIPRKILGYDTKILKWEDVSRKMDNGAIILKPVNEVEELLKIEVPLDENYQFQGEVGSLIERRVIVVKTQIVDGEYGRHVMNIMKDIEGQIYIWNSSIKNMFEIGKAFHFEAFVVNHSIYEGKRQTIINNLKLDKNVCSLEFLR